MISIVIPTFNEVQNIIPLIKNLIVLISDFEYEIIVVDDDSPDGTSEEVNKYMKLNNRIKLITRIGRSGLSSAIKEGLIFSQGKYILVLDGDGQHHPSFVLDMLNIINKKKSDIKNYKLSELIYWFKTPQKYWLNKKNISLKELFIHHPDEEYVSNLQKSQLITKIIQQVEIDNHNIIDDLNKLNINDQLLKMVLLCPKIVFLQKKKKSKTY